MSDEPHYVVARIRERLAQDPDSAELAVQVSVRRDEVFLAGPVSDDTHRAAICRVVRDAVPGMRGHDETDTVSTEAREAEAVAEAVRGLPIPVIAVLGNHDYHSDCEDKVAEILEEAGVLVLERTGTVVDVSGVRVGIAGTKGFGTGFPGKQASEFGEPEMRSFVRYTPSWAATIWPRSSMTPAPTSPSTATRTGAPRKGSPPAASVSATSPIR